MRECATALLHVAKREGIPIFLVGHVTKARSAAAANALLQSFLCCLVYLGIPEMAMTPSSAQRQGWLTFQRLQSANYWQL